MESRVDGRLLHGCTPLAVQAGAQLVSIERAARAGLAFRLPRVGFKPGWKALGSIQIVAREFLDKLDDASPHPPVLYPHERLGERAPVARGEEFVHIGRRCGFSISLELPSVLWSAFEKEGHRDLQDMRDLLQAARPHA